VILQKKRIKTLAFHVAVFAAAAGLALAYHFLIGGCPIRALLGVPCPTCGMSRAALALLRLDFAASLRYHPLLVPFSLSLWFAIHKDLFRLSKKARDGILIGCAAVVFAVYLIRLLTGGVP